MQVEIPDGMLTRSESWKRTITCPHFHDREWSDKDDPRKTRLCCPDATAWSQLVITFTGPKGRDEEEHAKAGKWWEVQAANKQEDLLAQANYHEDVAKALRIAAGVK